MSRLRLAVVGAGRAGAVHALNASRGVAAADLACVVDSDPTRAAELGARFGVPAHPSLEAALAHEAFDAVIVTTPTETHPMLVEEAAAAGRHALCEKPMALTLAACDRMLAATRAAATVLQIGFVRRYQPEFVEAQRRIAAGDIGTPMLVKSVTRGPGLPPPWAHDLRRSNGMLAEVNSHDFDTVRWLSGSEIVRVYAETANFKGQARGVAADHFYDNAVVTLRLAGGCLGSIDGTCPVDVTYEARAEVIGTDGLLVIGGHRSSALLEIRHRGGGEVPTFASWPERFAGGYREELRSFADAVATGSAPAATGADGRAAVAAVLAANRSWLETRPVAVADEETP